VTTSPTNVTTPVAGLSPSSVTTQATATAFDKDMFLQLLVAQMRYQNPMQPTDGGEYLRQTSQMATVEYLEQMTSAQAELKAIQMAVLSSSMVGKEVSAINPLTGDELAGAVEEVRFAGIEPLVVIDGTEVPVGAVTAILGAATPAEASAP
jgi:flagellar basal-body rod modification protein FlgD